MGWLRLPLLWRQSRQTLPRSNIEHTYVQVHSSIVLSCTFRKGFFLHFVRQCRPAKQLKMGSVWKVVRSDVFSSAVQQTRRAVVLPETGIHHTFWHYEQSSFLKHDAIPTIFQLVGSRRRYLKDVTNLKEYLPHVKKIRVLFQLWGHVFILHQSVTILCWHCMRFTVPGNPSGPSAQQPYRACSLLRDRSSVRRHHTDQLSRRSLRGQTTHFLFKYRASIDVTNSALSGQAYF